MAATKDPKLGALVLEKYLEPRLPTPVLESILRTASSAQPPVLSRADTDRLIARLRAEQPRQGQFPPARVHVERWALAQDAPDVLALAKEIASGDVPYSGNDVVLDLARKRVIESPKVSDAVTVRLSERLASERSQLAWKRAAGFLDHLPEDRHSAAIVRLTEQVVELAPSHAQAAFSTALTKRVARAPEAAQRRLYGVVIVAGAWVALGAAPGASAAAKVSDSERTVGL